MRLRLIVDQCTSYWYCNSHIRPNKVFDVITLLSRDLQYPVSSKTIRASLRVLATKNEFCSIALDSFFVDGDTLSCPSTR